MRLKQRYLGEGVCNMESRRYFTSTNKLLAKSFTGVVQRLTPLKAIRGYCRNCNGQCLEVRLCTVRDCSLYELRSGHKPKNLHLKLPPLAAIRQKCLDCCGGSPQAVRCCKIRWCKVWSFRFGKSPRRRKTPGRPENFRQNDPLAKFTTGKTAVFLENFSKPMVESPQEALGLKLAVFLSSLLLLLQQTIEALS